MTRFLSSQVVISTIKKCYGKGQFLQQDKKKIFA